MSFYRYNNRKIISLDLSNEAYKSKILEKQRKNVVLHTTPSYKLDDTQTDLDFTFTEIYWSEGDRLYKLSNEYYNSTRFWWVIAFFNQKPTDADYKVGDLVLIPTPLENAISFMGLMND